MALGGGTFPTQNKIIPGTYINFVSLAAASASLADRGIAAIGISADWGDDSSIIEITNSDFQKNSQKLFGYSYDNEKLKGLRDVFKGARLVYAYRLNGSGDKATNTFATALYAGIRGNDIKIKIAKNVDDNTKWDVTTLLDNVAVDVQTVAAASNLVANDYVTFKTDATLAATVGTALAGGTNSTVTGTAHQAFLDKIERYSFNVLGCTSTTDAIKTLYINFTERLRDEMGVKFQLVLYNKAADYEGVINVKNAVTDTGAEGSELVYWVTGHEASKPINESALNDIYDGEYTINVNYTQAQLEAAINAGEFTLHQVGDDIRVLMDINSLTTVTSVKGNIFKDNQTIRVIDQIANDIAVLFNTKYLGVVPNDDEGRTSLWGDIVQHHQELQTIRAIEEFSDEDIVIEQGATKKAVVVSDAITVIGTMEKLYMTVTIQ